MLALVRGLEWRLEQDYKGWVRQLEAARLIAVLDRPQPRADAMGHQVGEIRLHLCQVRSVAFQA